MRQRITIHINQVVIEQPPPITAHQGDPPVDRAELATSIQTEVARVLGYHSEHRGPEAGLPQSAISDSVASAVADAVAAKVAR